jgi:hypothetical protein
LNNLIFKNYSLFTKNNISLILKNTILGKEYKIIWINTQNIPLLYKPNLGTMPKLLRYPTKPVVGLLWRNFDIEGVYLLI